jgi:hypothetical protein
LEDIAKRYDPELDGPVKIPSDVMFKWRWPREVPRVKRRLTNEQWLLAQKYINYIVRSNYPFQIRGLMGKQLWLEFCEYWAANPDFEKAIRYL